MDTPGVSSRPASLATLRPWRTVAAGACLLLVTDALAACEAPAVIAEPTGDLGIVSENWDLDIPASAGLEEYYSSEHGPHGERDAVYVLSLDLRSRTGHWDPAQYTSKVHELAPSVVEEIVDEADARFTGAELQALQCRALDTSRSTIRTGDDHLITCVDLAEDVYVIFERIS